MLTADKDFGELVFRRGQAVPGLILIGVEAGKAQLANTRLMQAIEQFGERLFGRYVVIEEGRFRSRPL